MIDHILYGVPDLTAAVTALEQRVGVRAAFGGSHSGLGTHNALLDLGGSSYLEVIAPDPAQQDEGRLPFGLHASMKPRVVAWAVRTREIEAQVLRSRAAGCDLGTIQELQRRRPDGAILRWRVTSIFREELSFQVPFLIDWGEAPHPAHTAPGGAHLVEVRIEDPDPASMAAPFQAMGLQVPVTRALEPAIVAVLDTPEGRVEMR